VGVIIKLRSNYTRYIKAISQGVGQSLGELVSVAMIRIWIDRSYCSFRTDPWNSWKAPYPEFASKCF